MEYSKHIQSPMRLWYRQPAVEWTEAHACSAIRVMQADGSVLAQCDGSSVVKFQAVAGETFSIRAVR